MSDNSKSPLAGTTKALVILLLKVAGVAFAFCCRILALFLNKLSDLLEKVTGNGKGH